MKPSVLITNHSYSPKEFYVLIGTFHDISGTLGNSVQSANDGPVSSQQQPRPWTCCVAATVRVGALSGPCLGAR